MDEMAAASAESTDVKKSSDAKKTTGSQPTACASGLSGRRIFLRRLGWFGVFAPLAGMVLCIVRFFFPRVLFEPSPIFKAGFPEDYTVGAVNTKYKAEYGVWIAREADGFFALLAVCTHLGCTPTWFAAEDRFKCPCHGTSFTREGINYEGPAPRPLERVKITMAEDGQLLIDKTKRYRQENGEWEDEGAILRPPYV